MNTPSVPTGIIDSHVHTAPDFVPRSMTDRELAVAADKAGYRAVVLKSHHTTTGDRAAIAEEWTTVTRILGGVVMNPHSIGGVNPTAVDTACTMGARVVWCPTFASANHVSFLERGGRASANRRALGRVEGSGVSLLDSNGHLTPKMYEVLDLLVEHDATLATGHASLDELAVVIPAARNRGIRVIVTHPELGCIAMPVETQIEYAALGGVWFERVYAMTLPTGEGFPIPDLAQIVRAVGTESTIMATDLGQVKNMDPIAGMAMYIEEMAEQGFSSGEIETMVCQNPGLALGLDTA